MRGTLFDFNLHLSTQFHSVQFMLLAKMYRLFLDSEQICRKCSDILYFGCSEMEISGNQSGEWQYP